MINNTSKRTVAQIESLIGKFDREYRQATDLRDKNILTVMRLDVDNDQLNARIRNLRAAISELEDLLPAEPSADGWGVPAGTGWNPAYTGTQYSAYPVTSDYGH